jgi:hypothetical protein
MKRPQKIRPPAARTRRTEAHGELSRPGIRNQEVKDTAIPEHLDRGLPVTDKRKSAWQKARNPLQRGAFEVSLS